MLEGLNLDNSEFEKSMDNLIKSHLDLQLIAMILQHKACIELRSADMEKGLIMLESIYEIRKTLTEQKQRIIDEFGIEEIEASCIRINFNQLLYSSVSDEVIKHNELYFDIESRPSEAEYICNEDLLNAKINSLYQEYFPTLAQAA